MISTSSCCRIDFFDSANAAEPANNTPACAVWVVVGFGVHVRVVLASSIGFDVFLTVGQSPTSFIVVKMIPRHVGRSERQGNGSEDDREFTNTK